MIDLVEIKKQSEAVLKSKSVIESCTNEYHLKHAKVYIDLFVKRFKNFEIYKHLLTLHEFKKTNLKSLQN